MTSHQSQADAELEWDLSEEMSQERNDSIAYAVLAAVEHLEETDAMELPPLADAFDPENLDRLVRSLADRPSSEAWEVTFGYAGYEFLLDERSRLVLRNPSNAPESKSELE